MSGRNRKIGHWGENVTAKYLEERGYRVLARNVRTPYGEIDIIVQKDDLTIFVKVKTRISRNLGPPEISVTRKQEHMLAAAEHYASQHEIDHWQIDVMAVEGRPGKQPDFTHFGNAI